jgi:hypothetical protein
MNTWEHWRRRENIQIWTILSMNWDGIIHLTSYLHATSTYLAYLQLTNPYLEVITTIQFWTFSSISYPIISNVAQDYQTASTRKDSHWMLSYMVDIGMECYSCMIPGTRSLQYGQVYLESLWFSPADPNGIMYYIATLSIWICLALWFPANISK